MKELFFATSNQNKAEELKTLTADMKIKILTVQDFPNFIPPEETGTTFSENALIKAKAATEFTGLPALADDSGLTVDALDGTPGIYSARYSGVGATSESNNEKLLKALNGVPANERQGQFRTVLALYFPDGRKYFAEGIAEGKILTKPQGDSGFGYDPLFYVASSGKTMAELTMNEKNKISHRGKAFRKILKNLETLL